MKRAIKIFLFTTALLYLYSANSKDMTKITMNSSFIHGEAGKNKTKEYRSWQGLINRCTNVRNTKYSSYGGRGIMVCDRWRYSYVNFLEDMGRAPTKMHSIEREKNDGHYEPGNCKWATKKEQANNTRRNKIITYQGTEYTMSELCDTFGFNYHMIAIRLRKGWDIDKALTQASNIGAPVSVVASLSELQVRVIKQALSAGFRAHQIAAYFKCRQMTISRIKNGVVYRNVVEIDQAKKKLDEI